MFENLNLQKILYILTGFIIIFFLFFNLKEDGVIESFTKDY